MVERTPCLHCDYQFAETSVCDPGMSLPFDEAKDTTINPRLIFPLVKNKLTSKIPKPLPAQLYLAFFALILFQCW